MVKRGSQYETDTRYLVKIFMLATHEYEHEEKQCLRPVIQAFFTEKVGRHVALNVVTLAAKAEISLQNFAP
jgi:hypothetical protein